MNTDEEIFVKREAEFCRFKESVVTAIRAIKTEALDQVSGATEDTGSDTQLSYIIDLCDKALVAAGASTL